MVNVKPEIYLSHVEERGAAKAAQLPPLTVQWGSDDEEDETKSARSKRRSAM